MAHSSQARQSAFVTYAEPLRIAVATHALELQLQAMAFTSDSARTGLKQAAEEEAAESPHESLLALFAGSLAQADPPLLSGIEKRLRTLDRRSGAGDFNALKNVVQKAQVDLAQARKLLVPETVVGRPEFRAALIAKLAVSRLGFGAAYEEAAEGDKDAYQLAWLTLQRVAALWDELKPDLASAMAEVEPILKELASLMPSAKMPAKFRDPEDVEGAALDLVFALERGLAQPLLVRGFAPQLEMAQQQVDHACAAAAEGKRRVALENALAGRFTYDAEVGSAVAVVAPELAAEMEKLWIQLAGISGAAGADGETCSGLRHAMVRVGKVLSI